jgi:hypothetical protein
VRARLVAILGLMGLATACRTPSGAIYTHTITPLTTNLRETPVVESSSRGDVRQIDYSSVRVRWSSNGLGEIAQKAGFSEIYYADLETLSVLGIWTQRWAHVYGRK